MCAGKTQHGADCSFAETARQFRMLIADDVTYNEIIMAADRVRAQWRRYRHIPGRRAWLEVIEANCPSWTVRGRR